MARLDRSATLLIDKKGTIRYILRTTNPRGSFDREELLKAISTLKIQGTRFISICPSC